MLRLAIRAASTISFLLALAGCSKPAPLPAGMRPATWAAPRRVPGAPDLFEVTPQLYRGQQPTKEGIAGLRRLGIRTIVNLRSLDDDDDDLAGQPVGYVGIHFHVIHPEDEDMIQFLQVATDPSRQPVFVHCMRGIDRTGTMIAMYRMVVQGWTREEAIREMTLGGFGYDNQSPQLLRYLRKVDVDELRRRAAPLPVENTKHP